MNQLFTERRWFFFFFYLPMYFGTTHTADIRYILWDAGLHTYLQMGKGTGCWCPIPPLLCEQNWWRGGSCDFALKTPHYPKEKRKRKKSADKADATLRCIMSVDLPLAPHPAGMIGSALSPSLRSWCNDSILIKGNQPPKCCTIPDHIPNKLINAADLPSMLISGSEDRVTYYYSRWIIRYKRCLMIMWESVIQMLNT